MQGSRLQEITELEREPDGNSRSWGVHMHLFQKESNRDTKLALFGGIGLGALLMYVFDPERGARRRALARDKALRAYNRTGDLLGKRARDLRNRSKGLAAKARPRVDEAAVPDDVLTERVRARIGHAVGHPGSIEVSSRDGIVSLAGPVLAKEVDGLLDTARKTPGVEDVENRLDVRERPGDAPGLQGTPRTGSRRSEPPRV
jgi:hypothetical protein